MEIRPFIESDEEQVASLWRESFPNSPPWNDPHLDIQRKLAIQRELFLVAVIDGRIVGTAMTGYDGHRAWVYYVAVHPEQRRRGIGTALMRRVEAELEKRGCPKLNLQVRSSNSSIVRFYEHLGYKVEDHISMGKLLKKEH